MRRHFRLVHTSQLLSGRRVLLKNSQAAAFYSTSSGNFCDPQRRFHQQHHLNPNHSNQSVTNAVAAVAAVAAAARQQQQAAQLKLKVTKFEEVSCLDGGSIVKVIWGDGTSSSFHGMWLRDSCISAFDAGTGQRTMDSYKLIEGAGSRVAEVTPLDESRDVILVRFADGHHSKFSGEWLRSHSFEDRKKTCSRPELWTRDTLTLQRFDWNEWIKKEKKDPRDNGNSNNPSFSSWTQELLQKGLAMISGAPITAGTVAEAARRVAYPRRTHYGEVFAVTSDVRPTHLANTPVGLALHSDLNYRESSPGIQMLHCLENKAKGGLSTFCDGFAAAERMREQHPDEFALLTSVPIPFRLRGEDVDHYYRVPSICTDSHGRLVEVHVNDRTRAPLELPASTVGVVYRALGLFHRLLEAEDLTVSLRLEPGDVVAFNNRRILHGRMPFDADSGPRRLEGCYIDYDEFLAVSRFLQMAVPPQVKAAPG